VTADTFSEHKHIRSRWPVKLCTRIPLQHSLFMRGGVIPSTQHQYRRLFLLRIFYLIFTTHPLSVELIHRPIKLFQWRILTSILHYVFMAYCYLRAGTTLPFTFYLWAILIGKLQWAFKFLVGSLTSHNPIGLHGLLRGFFAIVEAPFYLQYVYIHSANGVRIGCYGLRRGTH
jgi:hypothetical protein